MGWTAAEKAAFLDQQFDAQAAHYQAHYPGLERLVVVADGEDVGRFYVCRWPDEIRLLDIALLPPWRNQGIGTRLVGDLLAEAADGGTPVTLFVEGHNRARRLYERFGFVEVESGPVYDRLEWRAASRQRQGVHP